MNMSYKICSVCTGNAYRSPFAKCVTKNMAGKETETMTNADWQDF